MLSQKYKLISCMLACLIVAEKILIHEEFKSLSFYTAEGWKYIDNS